MLPCPSAQLIIQLTPKRSVTMPKRCAQKVRSKGMICVPPSSRRRNTVSACSASSMINAPAVSGADQPCGAMVRHTLTRPLLYGVGKRLLQGLLGQGEIAEHPDERCEDTPGLLLIDPFKFPVNVVHCGGTRLLAIRLCA